MRKSKLYLIGLLVLALSSCTSKKQQTAEITPSVPKIILETDIGNDVDDALALDMLYKYLDAGDIDLLGITINKEGTYPAEYTDIMNTWYGYPQIPIGIIHNGADCENDATNYAKAVCLIQKDNGELAFKRSLKGDYNQLPEAPALDRKLLAQQPDSSVTIISVGFSTNLARLLPTTLVTSPFEVGIAINYPGSSIENDFGWAPMHPVVEAYKSYQQMPYDRPTWDLTSVLYSVEGPSYFNVSPAGKINVTDQGATEFTPDAAGNRYYLTVDSIQAENIKQHFVQLLTKQPAHFNK